MRLAELEAARAEAVEAQQRHAEDQVAEKEREAAALLAQAELRITNLSEGIKSRPVCLVCPSLFTFLFPFNFSFGIRPITGIQSAIAPRRSQISKVSPIRFAFLEDINADLTPTRSLSTSFCLEPENWRFSSVIWRKPTRLVLPLPFNHPH